MADQFDSSESEADEPDQGTQVILFYPGDVLTFQIRSLTRFSKENWQVRERFSGGVLTVRLITSSPNFEDWTIKIHQDSIIVAEAQISTLGCSRTLASVNENEESKVKVLLKNTANRNGHPIQRWYMIKFFSKRSALLFVNAFNSILHDLPRNSLADRPEPPAEPVRFNVNAELLQRYEIEMAAAAELSEPEEESDDEDFFAPCTQDPWG